MKPNYKQEISDFYKLSDVDLLRYYKNHKDSLAFFPLSKLLFRKKRYSEAKVVLFNGILIYPDFIDARVLLSKLYMKENAPLEAISELRKATLIDPYAADPYFYISEILFKRGDIERAKTLLTKAYELEPEAGHIKGSFEKHFKNRERTEQYNLEETIRISIHEINSDQQYKGKGIANSERSIENVKDMSFLDDLEKEFEYGKFKKGFIIGIAIILISIAGGILYSIDQDRKKEALKKRKNQVIKILNQDIYKVDQFSEKKYPDILRYYKLLFHYRVETKIYPKIVEDAKNLKPKNIYQHLTKMVYFLYENKLNKVNEIYENLKIKYKNIPDLFLLKGYQMIAKGEYLNAGNLFIMAYEKSNKEVRYLNAITAYHFHQKHYSKVLELLNNFQNGDIETELIKNFAENRGKFLSPTIINKIETIGFSVLKFRMELYILNHFLKKKDRKNLIKRMKKMEFNFNIPLYNGRIKKIKEYLSTF